MFERRLEQAEARHATTQKALQALKMESRAGVTSAESNRRELVGDMLNKQVHRVSASHWRRVTELSKAVDSARAQMLAATEAGEQYAHENALLRAEVAALHRKLAAMRPAPAMEIATSESNQAAAAAAAVASLNATDASEDDVTSGWTTANWLSSAALRDKLLSAVASALLQSLPREHRPACIKTPEDAVVERAFLTMQAEDGGRAALAALLHESQVVDKLAAILCESLVGHDGVRTVTPND